MFCGTYSHGMWDHHISNEANRTTSPDGLSWVHNADHIFLPNSWLWVIIISTSSPHAAFKSKHSMLRSHHCMFIFSQTFSLLREVEDNRANLQEGNFNNELDEAAQQLFYEVFTFCS